jgi:hypothetical protein
MMALGTQDAAAVIITVQANFQAVSGGHGPPLAGIDTMTSNGKTFTNTYVNPGDPFVAGTRFVRSIVATQVTTLKNTTTYNGIELQGGNEIVVIAAVDGVLVAPGVALFTSGRMGLVSVTPGSFNSNDPTSWGLSVTGDGMGGSLVDTVAGSFFTEYQLLGQDYSTWNNGDYVLFSTTQMNTSSVDLWAGQEQIEGRFNFGEDSPLGADPGDGFVTTTPIDVMPGVPGPVNIPDLPTIEGLLGTTEDVIEQLLLAAITAPTNPDPLGGAPLPNWGLGSENILNAIGMWGFGTIVTTGGIDDGFADWGAGTVADFIPAFSGGINTSGDFRATNDTNSRPTLQPIPEPATVAIWAVGLMGAVGFNRLRRRKARAAS